MAFFSGGTSSFFRAGAASTAERLTAKFCASVSTGLAFSLSTVGEASLVGLTSAGTAGVFLGILKFISFLLCFGCGGLHAILIQLLLPSLRTRTELPNILST